VKKNTLTEEQRKEWRRTADDLARVVFLNAMAGADPESLEIDEMRRAEKRALNLANGFEPDDGPDVLTLESE